MKTNSKTTIFLICCLAFLSLKCNQQQKPTPESRAADEAAIRRTDEAWSRAVEAKNLDEHNSYFLEDGVVLASNEPMVTGKEAIREMVAGFFATPGFAMKWKPTKVEAARSGDVGYSMGTYELTVNDAKGTPMTDRGKYLTVWKKQADGSWKVAADMFNSDLPVPPPAK